MFWTFLDPLDPSSKPSQDSPPSSWYPVGSKHQKTGGVGCKAREFNNWFCCHLFLASNRNLRNWVCFVLDSQIHPLVVVLHPSSKIRTSINWVHLTQFSGWTYTTYLSCHHLGNSLIHTTLIQDCASQLVRWILGDYRMAKCLMCICDFNISIYTYLEPFHDPCFGWMEGWLCFEGWKPSKKNQVIWFHVAHIFLHIYWPVGFHQSPSASHLCHLKRI